MSARVFVHPRCMGGPALGALEAYLRERGFDMEHLFIGPLHASGAAELVRMINKTGPALLLERLDGKRFTYTPEGEAA